MPPALHTDTLVVPFAELPPYQAKLPELKQRVGDRERDQFISGLTERLRSDKLIISGFTATARSSRNGSTRRVCCSRPCRPPIRQQVLRLRSTALRAVGSRTIA